MISHKPVQNTVRHRRQNTSSKSISFSFGIDHTIYAFFGRQCCHIQPTPQMGSSCLAMVTCKWLSSTGEKNERLRPTLSGGNTRLAPSCLPGNTSLRGEKLWECSWPQSDEEICGALSWSVCHINTFSALFWAPVFFQQTCHALYNVKNRSCKDIILLNICNFADINANIHLFEMKWNKTLKYQ